MRWSATPLAAFLSVCAGPALADAIDGNWCHQAAGLRFAISGPQIVTPGGAQMTGDYSRHAFSYVVPAPEPGAGSTVFMTLVDENTVHLRRGATSRDTETWVRCAPSISAVRASPPA